MGETPAQRQAKYIAQPGKKARKRDYMRQYMRDYRRNRRNKMEQLRA